MYKTTLFLVIFLSIWVSQSFAQSQHGLFTNILEAYAKDGLVNYKDLCQDKRLPEYTGSLSTMDLSVMDEMDSMAFWINVYNAFTLKLICDQYPVKSINDVHTGGLVLGSVIRKTAWDRPFININGQTYTLNHIEHKILRPQYKDARIHFAIVCAAKSCPPLRSEAFEASKLDEQLNDQARVFLVQRADLNLFNLGDRTANISAIFKWFKVDFGKNNNELLIYLSRFLPDSIADSIRKDAGAWRVKFNPYDWRLNEQ